MRMRTDVEPVTAFELGRPEMIEEDERTDSPASGMRQRPPHRKSIAEIDAAGNHDDFERVAGITIARRRVLAAKKTHDAPHVGEGFGRLARMLNLGARG